MNHNKPEGHNFVYLAPKGTEQHCDDLHVRIGADPLFGRSITSTWKPNSVEIDAIYFNGASVALTVFGENHPIVSLGVEGAGHPHANIPDQFDAHRASATISLALSDLRAAHCGGDNTVAIEGSKHYREFIEQALDKLQSLIDPNVTYINWEERYLQLERNVLNALPTGNYYLDEPDGGSVSLGDQLLRMGEDAAKWRAETGGGLFREIPLCNVLGYVQPWESAQHETTLTFDDTMLGAESRSPVDGWRKVGAPIPVKDASPKGAVHPDDLAVDAFAAAMKAKLAEARAKGRGGWNGDESSMQQRLSEMLRDHVEKGDPRDVANFCMFLHQRGESISPKGGSTDAKDAARYRWLRADTAISAVPRAWKSNEGAYPVHPLHLEALDEAIDAAMQATSAEVKS